jgi:hypothetical protein
MIRCILSALFATTLFAGSASLAQAGDGCCYWKQVTCYEKVTDYVTKTEAYTKTFTCYDHCGKPYQVEKVCYREVVVPVCKIVPVTKWVKICH